MSHLSLQSLVAVEQDLLQNAIVYILCIRHICMPVFRLQIILNQDGWFGALIYCYHPVLIVLASDLIMY